MKVSLIIAAAGKGSRFGFEKNKLLVPVDGTTCLEKTLNAFVGSNLIDEFIVTSSPADYEEISSLVGSSVKVVLGGDTRTQSVKNALAEVTGEIVLIHDGARPFTCARIIKDCIESVKKFGSAITAYPSANTVLRANEDSVTEYLGKADLWSVQTPQAFFTKDIKNAYQMAGDKVFNDDGEVYKEFNI